MLFIFLLDPPWDNQSIEEIYIENYKNPKIGIIKRKELWKGCGLYLEFENKNRKYISFKKDTASYSIGNDCELNKQINRNDYFQKLPESNKCFIIRNDSILLFNCNTNLNYQFKKFNIPIKDIKEWNIEENYKWLKMPYKPIEKYLKNKQYMKYKSKK